MLAHPSGSGGRDRGGRARLNGPLTDIDEQELNVNKTELRDAIASHRPELHELTLDALRDEYRFPVLSADALCRVTSLVAEEAR